MTPQNVWITRLPPAPAKTEGPLAGLTFAVKDNIDVAGVPTTAGCPAFAYTPTVSATVVERLQAAGAVLTGKTNMDQFATGLVGTRSPYGACTSVFNPLYISGGSSSGSAVAVASSQVDFSLGTDTAGSGRVPAAFNNIIGVKPTRGAISTAGVVPACRTLDCVSIFARTNTLAAQVLAVAQGYDARDPFSRTGRAASPWLGTSFRFGVPFRLEFFGDEANAHLYAEAIGRLRALGGEPVEIDFTPFRAAAELLYQGPWVAERLAAIRPFFEAHADAMDSTVRSIIGKAASYSAVDVFDATYRLAALHQQTLFQWERMDIMLLPTAATTYTLEQIQNDPIRLNTNLGYYTNFVNLLDLAAIAIPAGFRPDGLPFGISLIGPAWTDGALLTLASLFHGEYASTAAGCVQVAVLGAHLTGQPLNWQLTTRGGRLIRTTRTAPGYRFYALTGTAPQKPGLIRDLAHAGPGIEVEIWAVPESEFGTFVAAVPPPLAIGSAELADGTTVKCFVCEPYAIAEAKEITHLGGWRNYLASLAT